ncbi:MmpS family transport accessory protein [Actinoplanes sp. Pm04-4]|uniref:MmpS family transport accessory protein n=1 Tax=Paractinoplanes pyxinae TaxID=2997416 RepID=A0ABT4AUZ2_9ACTN|nr:MmpS family transport accessory protein [Actinoplanes pyxinae]MCY1137173.1 MmpS family transport accessory protein [Actinoplanes pyxinae]
MTNTEYDGGNDDRRNTPPADPWMESAPTSPIDHGDTFVSPVSDDSYFGEPPHRRSSRGWWIVAAMVAFVACLGGLLLNPFNDDDGREQATPTPGVTTPAVTAAPQVKKQAPQTNTTRAVVAEPPADEVVYLVKSTGQGDLASVSYTDQDRDIIRKGEVKLPWKHTFRFQGNKPPLVVIAQRKRGGTGEVTCSITVGGKELSNAVQRGRYAAPQCSA